MTEYAVVLEQAEDRSWSAYAVGLPVFVVGQDTRADAEAMIRSGIAVHLEWLAEEGKPAPDPTAEVATVTV